MRILNLLFICFSLAFANVSYAHNYDTSCPMEQGENIGAIGHANDCCNDTETVAKTGEPCKTEQSCSVFPLVLFFAVPSLNYQAIELGSTMNTIPPVPFLSPANLWRPPTLS